MLQDISPDKLDNHFYPDAEPGSNSRIIVMRGEIREREILISRSPDGDIVSFPVFSDFTEIDKNLIVYLFKFSDEEFFLYDGELSEESIPQKCEFCKISDLRRENIEPKSNVFAVYTAFHL